MQNRRDLLKHSTVVAGLLANAGLLGALLPQGARAEGAWNKTAFEAKSLDDVMKALGAGKPTPSQGVTLTAPDIAENGAVVPLAASTTLPNVKRIALLVEKNPNALAGFFELSDKVEPNVATRVKMGQTSNVYAVAITADNQVHFAQKEVKVTLGGCGG